MALVVWFSWVQHHPINRNVVGSIPGQGARLGYRFRPKLEHVQEATPFDVCVSLSLPSPLSKIISMSWVSVYIYMVYTGK